MDPLLWNKVIVPQNIENIPPTIELENPEYVVSTAMMASGRRADRVTPSQVGENRV